MLIQTRWYGDKRRKRAAPRGSLGNGTKYSDVWCWLGNLQPQIFGKWSRVSDRKGESFSIVHVMILNFLGQLRISRVYFDERMKFFRNSVKNMKFMECLQVMKKASFLKHNLDKPV